MRVLASDEVREHIARRGGRVYVWTTDHRCCSGRLTLLKADTTRPPRWQGRSDPLEAEGLEVFLDTGFHGQPLDLELELRGRKKRISAFWNGCAFVI
jgi:hypothetical protein